MPLRSFRALSCEINASTEFSRVPKPLLDFTVIIKRQPFYKHPSYIEIQTKHKQPFEILFVKPFQIIVYVSITRSVKGKYYQRHDEAGATCFPAILDTGLNDNLCINANHLGRWTGLSLADLPIKNVEKSPSGGVVERRDASIWLHHNADQRSGIDSRGGQHFQHAFSPFKRPHYLNCHNILICPGPASGRAEDVAPRLPTLGLRALAESNLNIEVVLKYSHIYFSIYR